MQSSQCSRNPSFSTESPTFVRSSHWLYMNASWDRRRRRSDNMRPPGPVIDPELNFTRWMCFPTSCVPRLLSPSRRSPLHSITDTYVAGSKVVDTIAWLYIVQFWQGKHFTTPLWHCASNIWSKLVFAGFLHWSAATLQAFVLLLSPPPAHTDMINISMDSAVWQLKEEKGLSEQYLRFIEKSEHWTTNCCYCGNVKAVK